jgi:ATP-dependent Zn protease
LSIAYKANESDTALFGSLLTGNKSTKHKIMLSLSYFITLLLLWSQHDVTAFQTRSTSSTSSSQPVSSTTNQQQQQYRPIPSKQIIALSLLQQLQQRTHTKLHMSDSDDGVSFLFIFSILIIVFSYRISLLFFLYKRYSGPLQKVL